MRLRFYGLFLFAFHGFEAAAIELEQVIHMLFGFDPGGAGKPGGRGSRAADACGGSNELHQIECDIFIATGSKSRAIQCVHVEQSPKRDATRMDAFGERWR